MLLGYSILLIVLVVLSYSVGAWAGVKRERRDTVHFLRGKSDEAQSRVLPGQPANVEAMVEAPGIVRLVRAYAVWVAQR